MTAGGEFDGLPGTGKPIPGRGRADDDLWWVRGYLRREGLTTDEMLPASLRLRKEIERLPSTTAALRTEAAVREAVADLNRRIAAWLRIPTPPHVALASVDAERVVREWHAARVPAGTAADGPPAAPARRPSRRRWWRRG